jgi:hypothetical protein
MDQLGDQTSALPAVLIVARSSMYKPNKTFLICLFVYCVLIKVLPFALMHLGMDTRSIDVYPWSFTPLFAFGIFSVAMFRDVQMALLFPLVAYLLGDVGVGIVAGLKLGAGQGMAHAFYPGQWIQYLSLLACSACGLIARNRVNWGTAIGAALLGPTVFFIISNFGSWAFDPWDMYTRDFAGLMQSYIAGIPFYKSQMISTLCFTALIFSPNGIRHLTQSAASRESAVAAPRSVEELKVR